MANNLKNPRIILGGHSVEISQEEVMTVEDVADYLRVPRSSVYKLAQSGELPGRKVGKHWRFHRKTMEIWLTDNQIETNSNKEND